MRLWNMAVAFVSGVAVTVPLLLYSQGLHAEQVLEMRRSCDETLQATQATQERLEQGTAQLERYKKLYHEEMEKRDAFHLRSRQESTAQQRRHDNQVHELRERLRTLQGSTKAYCHAKHGFPAQVRLDGGGGRDHLHRPGASLQR